MSFRKHYRLQNKILGLIILTLMLSILISFSAEEDDISREIENIEVLVKITQSSK